MVWRNPIKCFGRFINPHIRDIKRGLLDLMLWRFGYYAESQTRRPPPENFQYPAQIPPHQRDLPSAVWIGHSTYLIQVDGLSILTDPLFSNYCSPIPFQILKRKHTPAIAISKLPPIDIVLISHNHYDHLDEHSVSSLYQHNPHILWIVPRGVRRWFQNRGIERVIELDWGESCQASDRCRVTATPSQHFSGRHLWDKNRTLWCGFVVETPEKTFYFVGDTGYNGIDFKEIGQRWDRIDLSLIPIGTYVPEKFMKPVHISPSEAVQIHCDVRSKLSLGMHWKTFRLSEEPLDLPPYDLYLAMQKSGCPHESFLPIEPGRTINW
ncbi:MAG: Lactamase protein [Parachlamydiales bacterium]|nr:Lactamase protein [Parachlamydiales bacterium]